MNYNALEGRTIHLQVEIDKYDDIFDQLVSDLGDLVPRCRGNYKNKAVFRGFVTGQELDDFKLMMEMSPYGSRYSGYYIIRNNLVDF